ncbi:alpha/beta fold hydrolase [Streptomyces lusitanus]|uniref:Alpha/beta hydrolase n=1 Tax=Streptomyces lusitanus TaxID=68232 RepID=A0ABU3JTW1_9ACTN|nr:alpha/beta hydrolase [Streptomyces lusitanus]
MSYDNLVIVLAVAAAVPFLLALAPRVRLPGPVLEIVAGVVLGPAVLDWVRPDGTVEALSVIGLGFLLFLAGLEIDLKRWQGPAARLVALGLAGTLALAAAVGWSLDLAGLVESPLLVGIALVATSLGVLDLAALGHERFSLVGHDTGMIIAYALAADFPERVERVALAEVPGPPGVVPSPPLFVPEPLNNRLWHIPFNRVDDPLVEQLVTGNEDVFYGYEFAVQGGGVPEEAMDYYVRLLSNPESLTGSFGFYRAWDETLAQNEKRARAKLTMPVLGIGGADSWGPAVADSLKGVATNVRGTVIPDAGHWLAEQAPDALLATLTDFLRTGRADASPLPAET